MDEDRESALLTPRQRSFLRGESDLSPRGKRASRQRIRDRLRESIIDMRLIADALSVDDIEKALSEPDVDEPGPGSVNLAALVTVLYLSLSKDDPHDEQLDMDVFTEIAEFGVVDAVNRRGRSVEWIEFDGHIEYGPSFDELAHDDLTDIPREKLNQLHSAGSITDEQYAEVIIPDEAIRRQLEDESKTSDE